MIHVLAVITAHPGKRAALMARQRQMLPEVRAEKGCVEYLPTIDGETSPATFGSDIVVVIEKWETREDFAAHATAPHVAAYRADIKDLMAKIEIHVLQEG